MQNTKHYFTLSNGIKIPCIGLGTWKAQEGDEAYNAVMDAIKAGYSHIDTAHDYQNEESVGKAIRESGINREDIFVTTKLWNAIGTYRDTIDAFNNSLEKLGLEYIDLYLIHWPIPVNYKNNWEKRNAEVWRAMEDLYLDGKIKAIGVSNFLIHHLKELEKTARIRPMVNQLRLCPGVPEYELVNYCQSHNIVVEAYSPFSRGLVFKIDELKELSKKYNKTIAQIVLRWCYQKKFVSLPKSVTTKRIIDNVNIFDFNLNENDIHIIDNVNDLDNWDDPDNIDF